MDEIIIWDDINNDCGPMTPEVKAVMLKWYDEMVASGRIKVGGYRTSDDAIGRFLKARNAPEGTT